MTSNIPENEIKERWKKIKEELSKSNNDALLIPLGINFYYLFGKQGMPTERIIAGIIPQDGDPFILSPSFERSNIERSTGLDDIVIWEETDNAYDILAKDLNDRGIGNNLAVDPKLWIVEVERIQKFTGRHIQSAGNVIDELRKTKSEWEIKQLQLATQYSTEGILAAFDKLKTGITEKEFKNIVSQEASQRSGNPLVFGAIQFGENSAFPHGMPTDRKLKDNEVVLVDAGTSFNGYQGDITITIPHGNPEGFKKVYEIVYEANRNALDADKEGISGSKLDSIARNHIESNDYGKYFTHRLGHGLGLEVHEEPYIVGTNKTPLMAGNTHTIEPGIYIPGKFGVRIEDDVLVTKNGAKLLFDTPRHNFD